MIKILEVKTKSPFGFESNKTFIDLFDICNYFGDIISIHTNYRWGGSWEDLKFAKNSTNKPILAKGIHNNDGVVETALRECHADFCLVVGRIPDSSLINKCILEPENLAQLKEWVDSGVTPYAFLWNNRDLKTGQRKTETFLQARYLTNQKLFEGSMIKDILDVSSTADGCLVGENLENFVDSLPKSI